MEKMSGAFMHEMSIAQSLIEIVKEEMAKHDARKLRSIRLNIGEMSTIVPEALSFCFEVITDGTELEGARLITEVIPLMGMCHSCGMEFDIEDFTFVCPSCGGSKVEATAGQDLTILEIEVD